MISATLKQVPYFVKKGKYTLFYVRLFVNQLPVKTFHSFHLNKRPVKHALVIMLFMSNK